MYFTSASPHSFAGQTPREPHSPVAGFGAGGAGRERQGKRQGKAGKGDADAAAERGREGRGGLHSSPQHPRGSPGTHPPQTPIPDLGSCLSRRGHGRREVERKDSPVPACPRNNAAPGPRRPGLRYHGDPQPGPARSAGATLRGKAELASRCETRAPE